MSKKLETEYVNMELEDGILIGAYKVKVISLEIAKEIVRVRKEFCDNRPFPSLVLDYGVSKLDKGARDYFASKESTDGLLAAALITNSVFNRTLINFFLKVTRPKIPLRLFTDVEEAKVWLKQWVK